MTRFQELMSQRIAENLIGEPAKYSVYPPALKEPYRSRRFAGFSAAATGKGLAKAAGRHHSVEKAGAMKFESVQNSQQQGEVT